MTDRTGLYNALQHPFSSLALASVPHLQHLYSGKVREIYALEEFLVVVTTDRVSAFDVVLGTVPVRGQILNQLTAFWAQALQGVMPTHLIALPDPNVMVVHPCQPIRVEVIVRGYITGVTDTSLWTRYRQGARVLYGHRLPEGLQKDDPLPEPLITPTTKALVGHDEPLTSQDIVSRSLLDAKTWAQVQDCALRIFAVVRRWRQMPVSSWWIPSTNSGGDPTAHSCSWTNSIRQTAAATGWWTIRNARTGTRNFCANGWKHGISRVPVSHRRWIRR